MHSLSRSGARHAHVCRVSSAPAAVAAKRPVNKQDFYRYCRLIHGWLSAFAFLILLLFSITGLLLNHPDWSLGEAPDPIETTFELSQSELEQIGNAEAPEQVLVEIAGQKVALRGAVTGGDEVGNELFVRMQGVRGLSDIRANLTTGKVAVIVEPAPTIAIFNELHRGERAGTVWRLLIDVVAVLLIVLSIIGYLIFLSLKFRLRTALLLTAASAALLWVIFVAAVA